MRLLVFVCTLLLLVFNPAVFAAKLTLPTKDVETLEWSEKALSESFSVKPVYKDDNLSVSVLRLHGQEKPHYHDRHDLFVTVVSGDGVIHFKDRSVAISAGDTVVIPRGTYHWAQSKGAEAAVFYVIFSPAFDPLDRRFPKD
ncbi:MAG: cupin domain-containing protein [Agarilytica sp.]